MERVANRMELPGNFDEENHKAKKMYLLKKRREKQEMARREAQKDVDAIAEADLRPLSTAE